MKRRPAESTPGTDDEDDDGVALNNELTLAIQDEHDDAANTEKPGQCDYYQVLTPTAAPLQSLTAYCPSTVDAAEPPPCDTTPSRRNSHAQTKFWVPSVSSPSHSFASHSHRDVSDGGSTHGSRHSTRSGCRSGHDDDGDENTPCRLRRPRKSKLPSSHYYVDAHGRLRVRPMWWLYMRLRRFLWVLLPWFKPDDSNTFVCSAMISNSALIVTVFILRLIINKSILSIFKVAQEDTISSGGGSGVVITHERSQCHEFSQQFLELFSYSLIGNVMLCLPAFNLSMCRLFRKTKKAKQQHASPALSLASTHNAAAASNIAVDDDEPQYEKTMLFTILELLVIFEIPYLIVTFVMMVYPNSDGLVSLTIHCYNDLSAGYFIAFLIAQIIGVFAYSLRWNQILIFHRMHEHFLYQRGCLPGRARFDYVESSFRSSLFASKASKLRHKIQKELYRAAKYGDVERVRDLLTDAIDVDGPEFATKWYGDASHHHYTWSMGQSLLFARCRRNPLHVAVVFDHVEVVEALLSNSHFDVHQLEKMELLKINISWVYAFLFEIVSFLRRSTFSVDKTRLVFGPVGLFKSTLLTPLHVAVSMGNTDMALMLLRYGADPNLPARASHRKYATPALFWAVNKECTRLLLDADANPLYVPGKGIFLTPFEVARVTGNVAVARQMEKYGADVALTPLHDAASKGLKDVVTFYLEHGADPNCLGEKVTGYFRRTPLHWAAMRGETGVMKVLLRYGAEVDAKDVFGRTPLIWACVLNRVKAVELLLVNGANCNLRDIQGDPLLCICAAGASTTLSSSTPASNNGNGNRSGNFNNDRCGDGGASGDREPSGGADDNHHGDFGHASLARSMDPHIFQLLKTYGVDLHAMRQCNGDTALHVALRKNNESAAILFVRAGISLTAVNYMGQRAMDCAMSSTLRYAIKKEAGHRDVMISYCHSHASLARKLRDALEKAHVTTWIDSMDPSGITGGSIWRQEIAQGIQSSALVLAMLTEDYPMSQWCMKELAFAKMQNVPVVAIQCEDMEITEELQVYLWTRQIVDFRPAVLKTHNHTLVHHSTISASPTPSEDGNNNKHGGGKRGSHASAASSAGDDHHDDTYASVHADKLDGTGVIIDADSDETRDTFAHEYDEDKFWNCMRLLLDGIQDQIEEHRVRVEKRQTQNKMLTRSKAIVNDDDEHESGLESDSDNENAARRSLGDKNGAPDFKFLTGDNDNLDPTGLSTLAIDPGSSSSSYVFIANGDYHKSFCQRLKNTLAKQGIRSVVDQSVPAVHQFGYSSRGNGRARSATHSRHSANRSSSSARETDVVSLSVQARQMAAKDAILGCSAVLIVISPLSAKCDMLADQLAFAEDRGKVIVPVLLSLHSVDLAKRYTFSRSVIHHFNTSIGFEQSAETLVTYLRGQAQGFERQRRRRQRRRNATGNPDAPSEGMNSPASSTRSSFVSYAASGSPTSPSATANGELLPVLSIIPPSQARRQPSRSTGTSSGHGWSASPNVVSPQATGENDDALVYQHDHLHQQFDASPSRQSASASGRNPHHNSGASGSHARVHSNSSTRTTEYQD
ncbi:Transmembrane protein, partial [Globisporangium splendens]